MALQSKNYKLYVQIKIENRHDYAAALETIDKQISNIKDKVLCLQQYVPKLLKQRQYDASKKMDVKQSMEKAIQQ